MSPPRKLFSVGFVSLLVVFAAVSGAVVTTQASANTGTQAQQDGAASGPADAEPNDDRQNATPIDIGAEVSGRINITEAENGTSVANDVDFFAFEASAGQAININFGQTSFDEGTISLYGPEGEAIATTNYSVESDTVGGVADEAGTYYVRLREMGTVRAGTEGEYRFSVDLGEQDSFDPNDGIGNATSIDRNEGVNGTLVRGDTDVFAVEADANETITAGISARNIQEGTPSHVEIAILDPEGERIDDGGTRNGLQRTTNSTDPGQFGFLPARVSATAGDAGTYYVRVRGVPSYDSGFTSYELKFAQSLPSVPSERDLRQAANRLASNAQPENEPNSAMGTATRFTQATLTGNTSAENTTNGLPDDFSNDYFTFRVQEGETIRVEVATANVENAGPVTVEVYPPSAETTLGTTDVPAGESATVYEGTAEQTGAYQIRVHPEIRLSPLGPRFQPNAYALTVSPAPESGARTDTQSKTSDERPTSTNTLVIIGGSPESKVNYEFTYEGSVERSGKSHGAPIADRHVTIDPDVDEITDSRVNGRLGGGGDAYLVAGEVTGFELDGDAEVYLNGKQVDPATFGDVPDEETSTATPTVTKTSPSSTRVTTASTTQTATPSLVTPVTETTEGGDSPTADTQTKNGEVLGGTNTETNSSGPGFSLAAALVALLVAVSFLYRQR